MPETPPAYVPRTLEQRRRQRRRQRRAGAVASFLVMALGLAWFFESQATTTVVFVRFAETAAGLDGADALTPGGAARSRELARAVGDLDVVQGLDGVFATAYRPSQETADAVARQAGLAVQVIDGSDVDGLVRRVLRDYKGKIVLVVAEPEVIRAAIPEFHGSKKIPSEADAEPDNLYVVSIPWYGKVKTLRFRYGAPVPTLAPPAAGAAG
jgi:2,3-bisphosphoglycerate-dependent phosphoglycerate mutase